MNSYRRKSNRKLVFTHDNMREIHEKINNGQSKRSIAQEMGVPESTLRKRLKAGTVPCSLGRFKNIFNKDLEAELADFVKEMDKRFYGVTMKDLKLIAFEFAEANNIENSFNQEKKMAGKKWVKNFCARQNISLRQPEKCSIGRMIGFNRAQVNRFYENLKALYVKYNFLPKNIYNMDETGLLTVPNKQPKVFTPKGKKTVGKVASAERGQLITAVCCFNVTGSYIPPALIFPRKRFREDLYNGAPHGTLRLISDSGFINADLFLDWIKHFQTYAQPTEQNPVLLIFDNHVSHRTLAVINYCRDNHIHLLSIPPHSSHKLQPLDKVFFGPLKMAYSQCCDRWLVTNPGKAITQKELAPLFNEVYIKVCNIDKAVKGFLSTGIWPYNPEVFSDEDFAPSLVTDRPQPVQINTDGPLEQLPKEVQTNLTSGKTIDRAEASTSAKNIEFEPENLNSSSISLLDVPIIIDMDQVTDVMSFNQVVFVETEEANNKSSDMVLQTRKIAEIEENFDIEPTRNLNEITPPKSKNTLDNEILIETYPGEVDVKTQGSENQHVTLWKIRPLPTIQTAQNRQKKGQKSEILTSTPYKNKLEDTESNGEISKIKTVKRNLSEQNGKLTKCDNKKTRKTEIKCIRKSSNMKKRTTKSKADKKDETVFCPGCNEKYCDPPEEDWVQCYKCSSWWHEACSNYSGVGNFGCDLC